MEAFCLRVWLPASVIFRRSLNALLVGGFLTIWTVMPDSLLGCRCFNLTTSALTISKSLSTCSCPGSAFSECTLPGVLRPVNQQTAPAFDRLRGHSPLAKARAIG